MGAEAYIQYIVDMALPYEPEMRATDPTNPCLPDIDAWREKQLLKP